MLRDILDYVALVLVLAGAALALIAGIGVLRLPTVYERLHAATKPATLGLVFVCMGAALRLADTDDSAKLILAIVLQLLTIPIAAHAIGQAVYQSDIGRGEDAEGHMQDRVGPPDQGHPQGS
jgi:multicomponent Na+:H+ antiporter subunit G